jgi:transcriptional regulator with PAS, ATPase and Fis domain
MKTVTSRAITPEGRSLLKSLMAIISEAVLIIEPRAGCILEANHQAAKMLGYSIAELLALRTEHLFSPGAEFLRFLDTTDHTLALSGVQLRTKQGHCLSSTLTAQTVRDGAQKVVLVIAREVMPTLAELPTPEAPCALTLRETRQDKPESPFAIASIIGQSEQIRAVCQLVKMVAQSDTTVLIQGESGTGKELVAEAIHVHSRRNTGSLVKVNCAALTETLLESELFGHRKGAFTGAMQDRKGRFKVADGGTLILDEIDSLSLSGQAKLLRVLQEKEFEPVGDSTTVRVDVRVVAITNADLMKTIHGGRFREDLYYRLNAFPIRLPALCERKVDIPLLARHFLQGVTASLKKQIIDIDAEASALLMEYAWPGNARELENAIEYAAILEKTPTLTAASLPDKLQSGTRRRHSLKERLESVEKQIIMEALSTTNGVRTRTAELLGIDRRNLGYFLQKHAIRFPTNFRTEVSGRGELPASAREPQMCE